MKDCENDESCDETMWAWHAVAGPEIEVLESEKESINRNIPADVQPFVMAIRKPSSVPVRGIIRPVKQIGWVRGKKL